MWTIEKPTAPGWYRYRFKDDEKVIVRILSNGTELFAFWYGHFERVKNMPDHWSGPVDEPREANK